MPADTLSRRPLHRAWPQPCKTSIAELAQTGLVRHAIKAGEMAPPFRLRRRNGGFFSLSEVLDRGPAVISFFRGAWCPFCNLAMRAFGRAQTEIEQFGATLAGLSPFLGNEGSSILPVLSDPECRIAARYRIAFTVRPQFQPAYLRSATLVVRKPVPIVGCSHCPPPTSSIGMGGLCCRM